MKKALLVSVLAVTTILTTPALAQQAQCGPRQSVLSALENDWGESRQSVGLARNQVVEVFANLETGTWTITYTLPAGMTCLLASGTDYESLEETLEPNL